MYMSNLRTRFSNDYDKEFGTVYDRRAGRKPPVTKNMENEFYSNLLKTKKSNYLFQQLKETQLFFIKKTILKKM